MDQITNLFQGLILKKKSWNAYLYTTKKNFEFSGIYEFFCKYPSWMDIFLSSIEGEK